MAIGDMTTDDDEDSSNSSGHSDGRAAANLNSPHASSDPCLPPSLEKNNTSNAKPLEQLAGTRASSTGRFMQTRTPIPLVTIEEEKRLPHLGSGRQPPLAAAFVSTTKFSSLHNQFNSPYYGPQRAPSCRTESRAVQNQPMPQFGRQTVGMPPHHKRPFSISSSYVSYPALAFSPSPGAVLQYSEEAYVDEPVLWRRGRRRHPQSSPSMSVYTFAKRNDMPMVMSCCVAIATFVVAPMVGTTSIAVFSAAVQMHKLINGNSTSSDAVAGEQMLSSSDAVNAGGWEGILRGDTTGAAAEGGGEIHCENGSFGANIVESVSTPKANHVPSYDSNLVKNSEGTVENERGHSRANETGGERQSTEGATGHAIEWTSVLPSWISRLVSS